MRTHKDLEVWKRSVNFVTKIYEVTQTYPKQEKYGIVSQIRRAAVSIPSNISEGAARKHKREFIQFLYIALSSLAELETQIIISMNLDFIRKTKFNKLRSELIEIKNMLVGLIRYCKNKM
ncbi:MAG: four helix bundle protein [Candidatus Cloacimonetes bacterium]|nr:four helix bundle protein [Candidatus Cloacimonadota bacterium]